MCNKEIGMKKSQQSDSAEGNVTVLDFGEKFDSVVRDEALKLAGRKSGGSGTQAARTSRFTPGTYRPGMYGGHRPGMGSYKPWYANRMAGDWKLGSLMRLPDGVREKSKELFTGGLIGTAGNRVLAWVAPGILKTQSKLAVEAVAFGVTLIPYVVKQNVTTFGIALPGFFFFLGALADSAIGATNLLGPKPNLSGSGAMGQRTQHSHQDAVLAARRKLAEAQGRMQRPVQGGRPVMARPRAVAS